MNSATGRATALADRFERINAELVAEVEPYDDERWFALCPGEQATVAAVVSHVAGSYRAITGWARAIAFGEPPAEITRAQIDEGNARHAARHAQRPKSETLDALRTNAAEASTFVRSLTDTQLDRSAYLPAFARTMSAGEVLEDRLLGHPREHLEGIRAAAS